MIEYNNYGINIKSDFEIREIYEDKLDIDLFIALNNRPLNLYLDDLPSYIDNRIQLDNVANILLRLSKDNANTLSTIHFLQNIDIQSSIINFVIDYKGLNIELVEDEYNINLYIKGK